MMKSEIDGIEPYITRDGSEIRELLHPDHHTVANQSLAQACVPAGAMTLQHFHRVTEEIYHILDGEGVMRLGDQRLPVKPGDSIVIAPGTVHNIHNTGTTELRFLCCCSPAYSHADTEVVQPDS